MDLLHIDITDNVATLTMDDGKANALGHDMIDALHAGLDRAEADARAVVIVGREGKTSAGFDLTVMQEGPEAAQGLVGAGAHLMLRIFEFPMPVLIASTGHALAAGAILLMSADVRIGADVPAKIGMNEVAIGMPVPKFAVELARHTLSKRHFTEAINLATIYDPAAAIDTGFLDAVVPLDELVTTTTQRAKALADGLSPSGFAATRANCRRAIADQIRAELDADLATFTVG